MKEKSSIKEFFQDSDGWYSSTRLTFIVITFCIVATWMYSCFQEKKLLPMDNSLVALIGVLMAGKTGQSFSENWSPDGSGKTKIV